MRHISNWLQAWPLKFQTALITAVLIALGIAGLSLYVVRGMEADYQAQIGQEQKAAAHYVARSLASHIRIRRNVLSALADHVKDLPDHSARQLQSYLADKYAVSALFSRDVYILWKEGSRIAESPSRGMTGSSYAETPYFQDVMRSGQPVIQVILGRAARKPVLVVAVPIIGADGAILGAFCGTELIEGESFLHLSSEVRNGQTGGFHVFAMDQGVLAASTDASRVLARVPAPGVNALFDQRRSGYLGTGRVVDSRGVEIISAAAMMDTPNWMVIAYMPTAEAFEPLFHARNRIYFGACLIIALVGFLTWLNLRHALRPLENASRKMGAFHFDQKKMEPLPVEGSREIRLLLENFNALQAELARKNQTIATERDELEATVIARTQEYADLYDQAPCGYHSLSPEGVILRVNKTELALLGYTEEEFVGHRITEFMTAEGVQTYRENYPRFLATGRVRNLEFDLVCKDGSIRPFLVDGDLNTGPDGKPLYTRSTMVDNTDKKAQERRIAELLGLLQEVVETLPYGVFVLDETRLVVLHNKHVSDLLDYPADFVVRGVTTFGDIVRFNHQRGDYGDTPFEAVLGRFVQVMVSRQSITFERLQANGTSLEVCGLPLTNGWTLLTYTDITAHKQAEQTLNTALKASEAAAVAKSAFIANMSHEIRTPMNAILGLSYSLQKSDLPGEAQRMVKQIRGAGRLLMGILNDVLDFSKIESGKLEVQTKPFHLNDVLDNIASIMSANAQEKELELVITAAPLGGDMLMGDSLRLEQVLINLTGNAIKFTEHGHVALAIDAEQQDADGITLRFAVRDTGIGIPQEKQQLIFGEFSQADGSTSRKYGGTGLGLAISGRLVSAMGGELQVMSVPGEGSEFWFRLRLRRTPDTWKATPELADLKVLIAADHAMTRESLSATVQSLGWRALAFESGDALLERMQALSQKNLPPAVLLLDYSLPGKNGLEIAHAVRHELQNHSDAIVVLVSSRGNAALLEEPDAGLADAVLTKPVTPSAMYDAVARALRTRQGAAAPARQAYTARLQGLRMLVVDDSDINCEVAQHIFRSEGARVSLAEDGQKALAWLAAHPGAVDIVLMDIQMPVMNGYEATQQMRRNPAIRELPVVALTAGAFVEHQELARQAGMTGFIAKPFDVDQAVALILKLTGHDPDATKPDHAEAVLPLPGAEGNLPGLALAKALAIWRDTAHYQKYLRQFAGRYADIVPVLRKAHPADAQAIAHKFRGAAGNLGMEDVAAATLALEHTLQHNEMPEQALLELQQAMAVALDSIARYVPPVAPIQPDTGSGNDPPPPGTWLARLLTAWQSDSSSEVASVLGEMGPALPAASRQQLQAALDDYDFRAGEAATAALMQAPPAGMEAT